MTQALQIIQADIRRHVLRNMPLEAYDAFEAECALEEAGVDPDAMDFSPIDLITEVYIRLCEEALKQ